MKDFRLKIICLILLLVGSKTLLAQDDRLSFPGDGDRQMKQKEKVDSMQLRLSSAYMWKITPRLGEVIPAVRDSNRLNFHQSTLVEGFDVAMSYLGNVGSPAQSKIFFNRPETSRFIFQDGFSYWRKGPGDHLFSNSKLPYSRIHYQTGGGGETKEERFKAELSSNFGKKLNIGFDVDYIYSRGYYTNMFNKQINYDFYASYTGDKYKMHAYFANNNFQNAENGGITNSMFITNPDDESIKDSSFKGSLDIPVRINDKMWNRMRGRHIYVTNRYDLGENMEEYQGQDSVMRWRQKTDYVSPASIIFTTHYSDQRRHIISHSNETDELYRSNSIGEGMLGDTLPKYDGPISDYMSYWSFKNTVAFSMNEGFRPWMKFGLTAFMEYDARKYAAPDFRLGISETFSENSMIVGGILSSEKGKYLKMRASLEKDMINSDLAIDGNLSTHFKLWNKDFSVKANGYLKNISPSFFQNRFSTKYWNWDLNLKDTKRFFVGGEIESKQTKTRLSGGVESIDKYIYYGADGRIAQHGGNIQVTSVRLDQKLSAGVFHWDNQIVFQSSSDQLALPLPKLALYSNVYLLTKIAKVLTLQLGADVRMHTRYFAPGYEPLTMQFYNQREEKLGEFPMTTVYINAQMKYARFFIMYYNAAKGIGNSGYFSAYHYPVNPSLIKFGLSWSFNN